MELCAGKELWATGDCSNTTPLRYSTVCTYSLRYHIFSSETARSEGRAPMGSIWLLHGCPLPRHLLRLVLGDRDRDGQVQNHHKGYRKHQPAVRGTSHNKVC